MGSTLTDFYTRCNGACNVSTLSSGILVPNTGTNQPVVRRMPSGTSLTCNSAAFGFDPASGVNKTCYTIPVPTLAGLNNTIPTGFTQCATNGGTCTVSGGNNHLLYGSNGNFTYALVPPGTYTCDENHFQNSGSTAANSRCFIQPITTNTSGSGSTGTDLDPNRVVPASVYTNSQLTTGRIIFIIMGILILIAIIALIIYLIRGRKPAVNKPLINQAQAQAILAARLAAGQ